LQVGVLCACGQAVCELLPNEQGPCNVELYTRKHLLPAPQPLRLAQQRSRVPGAAAQPPAPPALRNTAAPGPPCRRPAAAHSAAPRACPGSAARTPGACQPPACRQQQVHTQQRSVLSSPARVPRSRAWDPSAPLPHALRDQALPCSAEQSRAMPCLCMFQSPPLPPTRCGHPAPPDHLSGGPPVPAWAPVAWMKPIRRAVTTGSCRVQGVGCRVWGAGCGVQGVGCRVWGARCGVHGACLAGACLAGACPAQHTAGQQRRTTPRQACPKARVPPRTPPPAPPPVTARTAPPSRPAGGAPAAPPPGAFQRGPAPWQPRSPTGRPHPRPQTCAQRSSTALCCVWLAGEDGAGGGGGGGAAPNCIVCIRTALFWLVCISERG